MHVNYVTNAGRKMASFRYRIADIVPYLEDKTTITKSPDNDADLYIVSKHFNHDAAYQALDSGRPVIMDVCDNHFESAKHGDYYLRMCRGAALVTCNSQEMKSVIGSYAPNAKVRVIMEPYEMPELNPKWEVGAPPTLMWFGHPTNLDTLDHVSFPGKIKVVSDVPTMQRGNVHQYQYSPEMVVGVAGLSDAAIIPTDENNFRKRPKSGNRFVEALRLGLFVIASKHPSHEEFARFGFIGDTIEGCKWLVRNHETAREMIKAGQDYIRDRFSAETVAKRWGSAIEEAASG